MVIQPNNQWFGILLELNWEAFRNSQKTPNIDKIVI